MRYFVKVMSPVVGLPPLWLFISKNEWYLHGDPIYAQDFSEKDADLWVDWFIFHQSFAAIKIACDNSIIPDNIRQLLGV